jgi:hypothetical protein
MAKEAFKNNKGDAYNTNVLPMADTETKAGSNNNLYQGPFEKALSDDNTPNGMGLARASTLKSFEEFPGAEASEWKKMKDREFIRYNELERKAFGRDIPITNEGIILDEFGGAYGEGKRTNPDPLEQKPNRPSNQE